LFNVFNVLLRYACTTRPTFAGNSDFSLRNKTISSSVQGESSISILMNPWQMLLSQQFPGYGYNKSLCRVITKTGRFKWEIACNIVLVGYINKIKILFFIRLSFVESFNEFPRTSSVTFMFLLFRSLDTRIASSIFSPDIYDLENIQMNFFGNMAVLPLQICEHNFIYIRIKLSFLFIYVLKC